MPFEKITGIYTITNTVNNKMYVGYAKNILGRFSTHRGKLRLNKHTNPHLQAAWNKHGEEVFEFQKLVECEEQFLPSEEHYWANLLQVHDRGNVVKLKVIISNIKLKNYVKSSSWNT